MPFPTVYGFLDATEGDWILNNANHIEYNTGSFPGLCRLLSGKGLLVHLAWGRVSRA